MPIFRIKNGDATVVRPVKYKSEKELQSFVERNLNELFNCRFVATEFSTGATHAGRIDTLALSEENNPVIIEYKIVESSDLINQSLFYAAWLEDHRGDFQVLVNNKLGHEVNVDWSDIRVMCISPGYRKYDLHAVKMMGANIELWKYKLYENESIQFEEVFGRSNERQFLTGTGQKVKDPKMVEAGKKAAETRRTGTYTFEEHLESRSEKIVDMAETIRQIALDLDDGVEENPKKYYVAYKTTKNFLCMEVQRKKLLLLVKINLSNLENIPSIGRDVSEIGHFGTGNFELTITKPSEIEIAREFIELSFQNIGG